MEDKKPFKETGLGKFLNKAKDVAPEVLNVAGKIATGNVGGAIQEVGNILGKKAATDAKAKELLVEFQIKQMDFEREILELEIKDKESARNREVEMAKSGRTDWMMYAVGICGLLAFAFCIYAVVYVPSVRDNDLFIHLLGMVEGAVVGGIFNYYYGTSHSSREKTKMIKN